MREVKPFVCTTQEGVTAVCLLTSDYEDLALNIQDILLAYKQAYLVIDFYTECIEANNEPR